MVMHGFDMVMIFIGNEKSSAGKIGNIGDKGNKVSENEEDKENRQHRVNGDCWKN